MKQTLYGNFLRLPTFKGKGRLMPVIRDLLFKRRSRRIVHDLRILLDPMESEQADILRDGLSEPLTTKLFSKLLKPGATYVDVGAHIGYHTLVARYHIGPHGTVFAIDPQPYNCNRILENWACNNFSNIVVYTGAAGPQPNFVSLPHQPVTGRSQLSMAPNNDAIPNSDSLTFCVPVIPLSKILSDANVTKLSLLKIDVEGFEDKVLQGLGDKAPTVENIVLEILPSAFTKDRLPVLERLRQLGFDRWRTVTGIDWQPGDSLPENNLWATR
jgi:FkbM family methyltransferase